jgi:RNA polymerase sigma factor (sigma-70 family)
MSGSPVTRALDHLRKIAVPPEQGGPTDGELLQRYIDHRDDAAFAALVHRHGPMVGGVCLRVVRHEQDAEDAFQAAFLVLARKAASVVPREAVGAWLHGVAYNTAIKARAASAKLRLRERQVEVMPEREAVQQGLGGELRPLLDQELSRLPVKYRLPVVLCDLEGRSRTEAARQLKVPEGTLSSRLTTARGMLAKRLARHGVTLPGLALADALSQSLGPAAVPSSVVSATIKAATPFAAGQAVAAGLISARVAALTEGAMKIMLLGRLKKLAVLVVLGTVALAGGLLARGQVGAKGDGASASAPNAKERRREAKADKVQPEDRKKARKVAEVKVRVNLNLEEVNVKGKHIFVTGTYRRTQPVGGVIVSSRLVNIPVTENAKIRIGDKEGKPSDLRAGMPVILELVEDLGGLVVVGVEPVKKRDGKKGRNEEPAKDR